MELLAGTRKGLVVLEGHARGPLEVAARCFPGRTVEYACYDPASATYLASVTDDHFGPLVWRCADLSGGWEPTSGPRFPADTGATLERVWTIVPAGGVIWAGVAPAALFASHDGGESWTLQRPLWDEPTRPRWEGGAGGLCLHSICPHPDDPARLSVAISAAGVWNTSDGGESWARGVAGLVPRYLPEEARAGTLDLCVHNMHRCRGEPDTLYMQFHGGVYRSDDSAESWTYIGEGLPSDFGFPLALDPGDPARAFVIPLVADHDRVTPAGRVRVYETTDRGATWRALGEGLPQRDAYLTVLRQALCSGRGSGATLELAFGATSGDVFTSGDGGATWARAAGRLPPVLALRPGATA